MRQLQFEDLGKMRYKPCWNYQEEVFKSVIARKIAMRDAISEEGKADLPLPTSHLLFVEHPHVLTLGRSGNAANVIVSPDPAGLKRLDSGRTQQKTTDVFSV